MRKKDLIFGSVFSFSIMVSVPTMAQTDTLAVDTTLSLSGVTVTGARVINKVDRKLVTPTRTMVRNSENGYDLLQKLSLPGLRVEPAQQKISSKRGGGVQIRINDVKASATDLLSLRPDEVVRVEYIDAPGVRYSDDNLDAVINYIVRRRYSGYVGGVSTMQAVTTGFNNTNAYFKYNHKKSEFSLDYNLNYRDYDKQISSSSSSYIYPDGNVLQRDYPGYYNTMAYNYHNLQLGYNLSEPDKSTLNIRLNLNWLNQPYSGGKQRVVETGRPDMFLYNRNSSHSLTPSLDIYYSLNMPHKQNLAVNVVGTYIGTDYKYHMMEYLFDRTPEHTMQSAPTNDYSYATDGKKYSLISEAIYSKTMGGTVFSAGAEYTVSHTDNRYTGSVNTDAVLNSDNLYAFAQLQGRLGWLGYQAGVGANYASIHQGEDGFDKWTFRPQLSLSTNAIRNVSIRYTGRITPRIPSLAQLSNVRQQDTDITVNDGNTQLQPYTSYSNSLTLTWSRPLFDFQAQGSWEYSPDVIMSSINPEKQADGSYLFAWKPENQKRFSNYMAYAGLTVHAIKDVLDLSVDGTYNRYESRGLTYSHNFDNWAYSISADLTLGKWNVNYSFWPASKDLWGESISGGERGSNLSVAYRHKNLTLGLYCLLLGYAQGYDYTASTDSRYYKSEGVTHIKNNGNMLMFTLSYNFSHGRKYNAEERKLNNSDRDSGVK